MREPRRNACLIPLFLLLASVFLASCASPPSRVGMLPEQNHSFEKAGYFSDLESSLCHTSCDVLTGVSLLYNGIDAFAARMELVRKAEYTLDLQYYLFHQDATGTLLYKEIWRAAERGVKVRLLLDDMEQRVDDYPLVLLDTHPNISVRLYNPFYWRKARAWQLLGELGRLNHRMHNKSLTVDNRASVVGGRNIGDEYFGANQQVNFGDADVFLLGSGVAQVTRQFDEYWNNDLVFPLDRLRTDEARRLSDEERAELDIQHANASLSDIHYSQAAAAVRWLDTISDQSRPLYWAKVDVWSDRPDLALLESKSSSDALVINRLWQWFAKADQELFLISPYFVPGEQGTEFLAARAAEGVSVGVVTNALAATDVVAVHSGYKTSRTALLASGVELFEVKPSPDTQPKAWSISSSSSLHAKVFVVDATEVFVGSFNLDPRSAWLNTEMGVLIESPALAREVLDGTKGLLQKTAYQLSVNDDGSLRWQDLHTEKTFSKDPEASWWRRASSAMLSWLPIESQL